MSDKSRVALSQGPKRPDNLGHVLDLVIADIDWATRQNVVVKPNLVIADRPHAITHRKALVVVLEKIRERYNGPVTIAEGCAVHPTAEAFERQGYPELARFYNCRLLDLNADETGSIVLYDRLARPLHLRLARTIVESDCRVSLALPKTHDAVLVTLSLKNIIMAALVNRRITACSRRPFWLDRLGQIINGHGNGWGSDKMAMHQNYPVMNINLALVAPLVRPHLSVVDGFVAMEGAGPVDGEPVAWKIAIAGTDPLAVDAFTARLMGFSVDEVGYLHYCAQSGLGRSAPEDIEVIGQVSPEAVARAFKPHPAHHRQRQWRHPEAAQLLTNRETGLQGGV